MAKINQFNCAVNKAPRAFATRSYPGFGRGLYSESNPPLSVINSPFYWWYKFLQLNVEYAKAFAGNNSSVPSAVVSDFGDVLNIDFKTWWHAHTDLFAEPRVLTILALRHYKQALAFIEASVCNAFPAAK